MTFSVKAGGSPHQHVSPSLGNRGGGGGSANASHTNPPPFSLGEAHHSTDIAIPLPASKRMGTDPTKYKTTICRNWEQTGACTFRGCTFAHGVDELRPPARTGTSPPLGPLAQASPSSTPPMYPQNANGSNNGSRLEQIMEMLIAEVQRERELVLSHADARRGLEVLLRREQYTVTELQSTVEGLQQQASELARLVKERNSEILELIEIAGPNLTADRRRRAEALATWKLGSAATNASSGSKGTSDKEASSRGNNPSAPVWVPPPTSPSLTYVKDVQEPTVASGEDDAKLKSLLESLRQH